MTPGSSFENDPVPPPFPLPDGESGNSPSDVKRSVIISALVVFAAVVVTMVKVYGAQGKGGPPDLAPLLMQCKYMVGVDAVAGLNPVFALQGYNAEELITQLADQTEPSPASDRALAALTSYLAPDKPELLDRFLSEPVGLVGEEAEFHDQFMESVSAANATEEVWASLREKAGWFGKLAQVATLEKTSPERQRFARSCVPLMVGYAGFMLVAVLGVVCGIVLLILAVVFHMNKSLEMRLTRAANNKHIYLEAFAVFLGGYTLSSIIGGSVLGENAGGLISFALLAGSYVLAMLWPRIRGIRFAEWRRETGLHSGRGWWREIFAGLLGYLAMLPMMAVAVTVVIVLVKTTNLPTPSHPIAGEFAGGGMGRWVFLFLLAVVFAPLFEEILFRGFFFSGLRGWWSWILSALMTGFVFAAIHPQGILGIPVLMAIAVGLALIREWRDSIIACITAHAINNGSVMLLVMIMFSS